MKRRKRTFLWLLCLALALLLCGCQSGEPAAPADTPVPTATLNPSLGGTEKELITRVLACGEDARTLETRVQAALNQPTALSVPAQITRTIADAASAQTGLRAENGLYTFTSSTGGRFEFDKPLAAVMAEGGMDSYTVSDEGEPLETQDAAFYDPLNYVMSGVGGGQFAYASYYRVRQDGNAARTETVSRLNEAVSGWSHDEYISENGVLWFADLQLSPRVNEGDSEEAPEPFRWTLCVGRVSRDEALVREYLLETAELAFPEEYPALFEQGADAVRQKLEDTSFLTSLEVEKGQVRYTGENGTAEARLP